MRCVAAILARNEASRYLERVLASLQAIDDPLCDQILLLDDGSTDGTVAVAESFGCVVKQRTGDPMWGEEAAARAELWEWGAALAGDDWLLIADADQLLVADPNDWRMMLSSWECSAWGFPLYDCWDSDQQFRADGYWQGFRTARPWLFRPSACPNPEWPTRGLHSGHAPSNFPYHMGTAPESVYWKHLGWQKAEDRVKKHAAYMQYAANLTPFERAHVDSILA